MSIAPAAASDDDDKNVWDDSACNDVKRDRRQAVAGCIIKGTGEYKSRPGALQDETPERRADGMDQQSLSLSKPGPFSRHFAQLSWATTEWVPLKPSRRQFTIIDPLHKEYAVCEGDTGFVPLQAGDGTLVLRADLDAPLSTPLQEQLELVFMPNVTVARCQNLLVESLRKPAQAFPPFIKLTGLLIAPFVIAEYIKIFCYEYQRVYAPKPSCDFGLSSNLEHVGENKDVVKVQKRQRTLCQGRLFYQLVQHHVMLMYYLLIFVYYAAVVKWDMGSLLRSDGRLAFVVPYGLPKVVTKYVEVAPAARQKTLWGEQCRSFGPRKARSTLSFPEVRSNREVRYIENSRWRLAKEI